MLQAFHSLHPCKSSKSLILNELPSLFVHVTGFSFFPSLRHGHCICLRVYRVNLGVAERGNGRCHKVGNPKSETLHQQGKSSGSHQLTELLRFPVALKILVMSITSLCTIICSYGFHWSLIYRIYDVNSYNIMFYFAGIWVDWQKGASSTPRSHRFYYCALLIIFFQFLLLTYF